MDKHILSVKGFHGNGSFEWIDLTTVRRIMPLNRHTIMVCYDNKPSDIFESIDFNE